MYPFGPCPVILCGGEVTGELDSLVEEASKQLSIHMVAWLLLSTSIGGQWKGGQSAEQKAHMTQKQFLKKDCVRISNLVNRILSLQRALRSPLM